MLLPFEKNPRRAFRHIVLLGLTALDAIGV